MGIVWKAYIQLARPANVVTAVSDVIAGAAIATLYLADGAWQHPAASWMLLVLATIGLYGGGVVFNDVFDAKLDAMERPERPIPSGKVPRKHAALLGVALFALGVFAAGFLGCISCLIAISIVLMCMLYDKWAKHHVVVGPIAMGLCRGLNLLLGMSLFSTALPETWMLAGIPVIYIAAVTTISRGEVHGGKKSPLLFSAVLYAVVIGLIAYFGILKSERWLGVVVLMLFAVMIYLPLLKAIRTTAALDIRKSVKYGVLALIFMNAVWVAAAGLWGLTVVVLSLFPISIWLSKMFSVT
ncbi:UbiA-like protein EboC [Parapedobacter koreensis]|uniref:4-hydroxybenzoate polyprenyltransferase n=1 Tax=Parapedobacter koreensis TaxID=332977 RepID=A0A1H7EYF4_9SPHI|nr:UbiA-like protein EboC [Parapedobacter koreensis]SEK18916.1 4-hydroxybenzoate polyprenyltransferase [Parapedobacter koreensis]